MMATHCRKYIKRYLHHTLNIPCEEIILLIKKSFKKKNSKNSSIDGFIFILVISIKKKSALLYRAITKVKKTICLVFS